MQNNRPPGYTLKARLWHAELKWWEVLSGPLEATYSLNFYTLYRRGTLLATLQGHELTIKPPHHRLELPFPHPRSHCIAFNLENVINTRICSFDLFSTRLASLYMNNFVTSQLLCSCNLIAQQKGYTTVDNLETALFTLENKFCARLSMHGHTCAVPVLMCKQGSFQFAHCCPFHCVSSPNPEIILNTSTEYRMKWNGANKQLVVTKFQCF